MLIDVWFRASEVGFLFDFMASFLSILRPECKTTELSNFETNPELCEPRGAEKAGVGT